MQKSIDFRFWAFGHQLDAAVRQITDVTGNRVISGETLGGITEAHTLDTPGIQDTSADLRRVLLGHANVTDSSSREPKIAYAEAHALVRRQRSR
jgi:hypothetical protein